LQKYVSKSEAAGGCTVNLKVQYNISEIIRLQGEAFRFHPLLTWIA